MALAAHYQPGDTDFGWTRATPWRSLLAATLDQPHPTITACEVAAEEGNPTAELIAAWLSLRLSVPVSRTVSGGPGITAAVFTTTEGEISVTRFDGRTATLSWPGRVDRMVALHRRDTAELLAEELRRLDPDEVYAETLHHVDVSAPAELPPADESVQSEFTPSEPAASEPDPGEGE
jgi:glucose-6-phosphate dehydrogenase assembly protein OpcA